MKLPKHALSRREFAKRAALGSAAFAAVPSATWTNVDPMASPSAAPAQAAAPSKLPAQSLAEAEARYQTILTLYPDRFSDAQKTDLKRLCQVIQEPLDALRAYSVSNSDQPALYLKPIVERAKATNAPPNQKLPHTAPTAKPARDSAKPSSAGKP